MHWNRANLMAMSDELASRLGRNVKELRVARSLTQQQMGKMCGLPRATWANIESGAANPTLAVLHRVAGALQVPIEELIAAPRAAVKHYPRGSLPSRVRGEVVVRSLLPDKVPGMVMERIELPGKARMTGVPHTPGTREYLTCESGEIELVASGEAYLLRPGDVVVFRGDQRHAYGNPGKSVAIGYSVVVLSPALT
jgi:XRE family transcriptional regulator, regulator of sulfur utilization